MFKRRLRIYLCWSQRSRYSSSVSPVRANHAGRVARARTADLLQRLLAEPLAPVPFVKAFRDAALRPRRRDDHVREEPDVRRGRGPYPVTGHAASLSVSGWLAGDVDQFEAGTVRGVADLRRLEAR